MEMKQGRTKKSSSKFNLKTIFSRARFEAMASEAGSKGLSPRHLFKSRPFALHGRGRVSLFEKGKPP